MSSTREVARGIKLPFPCGCLERHSAPDDFTVEVQTCETHLIIDTALRAHEQAVRAEERERAAKIAEHAFSPAHTYASENAERYHAFDDGQKHAMVKIAAAIRRDDTAAERDRLEDKTHNRKYIAACALATIGVALAVALVIWAISGFPGLE